MPRTDPDPATLLQQALAGDVRSRARLFSLIENGGAAAQAALSALAPLAGRACVVGITGPPGAGKSTLIGRLAGEIRRRGQTVAILAVDPSSPLTGGAVLGDRIRMQELHGDSGAYVRSLSTRGAVGGLARAVGDMVVVADALGYDVVLVETVGAGQDEADIDGVTPTVVLVEVPHLGDDVQAIKAGILELADILVVNKADRGGADQAVAILRAMLSLGHRHEPWHPPIVKTAATTGEGVPKLLEAIRDHQTYLQQDGRLAAWRTGRVRTQLLTAFRDRILAQALARVSAEQLEALVDDVASRQISLDQAVDRLLKRD
ncbi:MAG TPA: methylmalonyl Co-A mutase-associated GTPase MeaB [Chloroflexota bacterium]|nr:methylmalonyl Co-A mutase-associated GTPase MeaB [Chloroflexota bacterium]